MVSGKKHIVKTTGLLVVAATFFCVLFGQGVHLHNFNIHISNHFDIHAHVHAHESHDKPPQEDHDQEENNHQHEVSTTSDIIGTLTSPYQVSPDIQPFAVLAIDTGPNSTVNPRLQQSPTLFDLPPPRRVPSQYHLSSFSRRGPPIA